MNVTLSTCSQPRDALNIFIRMESPWTIDEVRALTFVFWSSICLYIPHSIVTARQTPGKKISHICILPHIVIRIDEGVCRLVYTGVGDIHPSRPKFTQFINVSIFIVIFIYFVFFSLFSCFLLIADRVIICVNLGRREWFSLFSF